MVVRVKWFYHPEETKPGRKPSDGKVCTTECEEGSILQLATFEIFLLGSLSVKQNALICQFLSPNGITKNDGNISRTMMFLPNQLSNHLP